MIAFEIKNNLFECLPIIKRNGSQLNLGPRTDKKNRKAVVPEDEANKEQLKNLARLHLISVRKIKARGNG